MEVNLQLLLNNYFAFTNSSEDTEEIKDQRIAFLTDTNTTQLSKRSVFVKKTPSSMSDGSFKAFVHLSLAQTIKSSLQLQRDKRKFSFSANEQFLYIGQTDDVAQRHILQRIGGHCNPGCKCTKRRTDVPREAIEIISTPFEIVHGPFEITNIGLTRRERQNPGNKEKPSPNTIVVEINIDNHNLWIEQKLVKSIGTSFDIDALSKENGLETSLSRSSLQDLDLRAAVSEAVSCGFNFKEYRLSFHQEARTDKRQKGQKLLCKEEREFIKLQKQQYNAFVKKQQEERKAFLEKQERDLVLFKSKLSSSITASPTPILPKKTEKDEMQDITGHYYNQQQQRQELQQQFFNQGVINQYSTESIQDLRQNAYKIFASQFNDSRGELQSNERQQDSELSFEPNLTHQLLSQYNTNTNFPEDDPYRNYSFFLNYNQSFGIAEQIQENYTKKQPCCNESNFFATLYNSSIEDTF